MALAEPEEGVAVLGADALAERVRLELRGLGYRVLIEGEGQATITIGALQSTLQVTAGHAPGEEQLERTGDDGTDAIRITEHLRARLRSPRMQARELDPEVAVIPEDAGDAAVDGAATTREEPRLPKEPAPQQATIHVAPSSPRSWQLTLGAGLAGGVASEGASLAIVMAPRVRVRDRLDLALPFAATLVPAVLDGAGGYANVHSQRLGVEALWITPLSPLRLELGAGLSVVRFALSGEADAPLVGQSAASLRLVPFVAVRAEWPRTGRFALALEPRLGVATAASRVRFVGREVGQLGRPDASLALEFLFRL